MIGTLRVRLPYKFALAIEGIVVESDEVAIDSLEQLNNTQIIALTRDTLLNSPRLTSAVLTRLNTALQAFRDNPNEYAGVVGNFSIISWAPAVSAPALNHYTFEMVKGERHVTTVTVQASSEEEAQLFAHEQVDWSDAVVVEAGINAIII